MTVENSSEPTSEDCGAKVSIAIERAVTDFRGKTPLTDDCTITEMIYRGPSESVAS